ncbi:hypothetical protein WJX74_001906 [Apatococcus lobatus]|uniref:Uncharacterized protein n=1 Tax=Apatococcus lobatus TaxID=904363 RepID=A0AAW1QM81_9CHLO
MKGLASPARPTATLNQQFCPELCAALSPAQQTLPMAPTPACIPPVQLVDTLRLLRRRGPALPLHSRWTPALPYPTAPAHGQQRETYTVAILLAFRSCLSRQRRLALMLGEGMIRKAGTVSTKVDASVLPVHGPYRRAAILLTQVGCSGAQPFSNPDTMHFLTDCVCSADGPWVPPGVGYLDKAAAEAARAAPAPTFCPPSHTLRGSLLPSFITTHHPQHCQQVTTTPAAPAAIQSQEAKRYESSPSAQQQPQQTQDQPQQASRPRQPSNEQRQSSQKLPHNAGPAEPSDMSGTAGRNHQPSHPGSSIHKCPTVQAETRPKPPKANSSPMQDMAGSATSQPRTDHPQALHSGSQADCHPQHDGPDTRIHENATSGSDPMAINSRGQANDTSCEGGQPSRLARTSPRRHAQVFLCPSPDRASRRKRVTWDWAGGGPADPLPASQSKGPDDAGPLSDLIKRDRKPSVGPPRSQSGTQQRLAGACPETRELGLTSSDDSSFTGSTLDASSLSLAHLAQPDDRHNLDALRASTGQPGADQQLQAESGLRADQKPPHRECCGCGPECWCRQPLQTSSSSMGHSHHGANPCDQCLLGSSCNGSCLLSSTCWSSSLHQSSDELRQDPMQSSQSSLTSLGSLSLMPINCTGHAFNASSSSVNPFHADTHDSLSDLEALIDSQHAQLVARGVLPPSNPLLKRSGLHA